MKADEAIDAFCDDWLVEHNARQTRQKSAWIWEPFDWHRYLLDGRWLRAAAIDQGGRFEGFIAADPGLNRSFLTVEYLQTAPWNFRMPARHGVGTLLLEWAVHESRKLGFNGALTLAARKGAEKVYDQLGFIAVSTNLVGEKKYELRADKVANVENAANILRKGP